MPTFGSCSVGEKERMQALRSESLRYGCDLRSEKERMQESVTFGQSKRDDSMITRCCNMRVSSGVECVVQS